MKIRGHRGLPLVLAFVGMTACVAAPAPEVPADMAATPGGERTAVRPDTVVGDSGEQEGPIPGEPGYRAGGNEPFWDITFGEGTVDFYLLAADSFTVSVPAAEPVPGGWRLTTNVDDAPFIIEVRDEGCNDSMSGMPFPHTVSVTLRGSTLHGCGGDPESLLTRGEWEVTRLVGDETGGAQRPTLDFTRGGEVTGTGGCNRFRSTFDLTGEGITFSPPVATRMACAEPELNEQEVRFFELLEQVTRFDIAADGVLELYAADRVVIEGRQ